MTAPLPIRPLAAPAANRASRRFRYLLLVYAILTVVTFAVVQRYTIYVARLYDYNIPNEGVQWSLYFGIYVVLTRMADGMIRGLPAPLGLSREGRLRLAFLAGATLSAIVAWYQWQYGTIFLVNYFTVGTMGTFAAALWLTRRDFGLVEVIARPSPQVVAEVERGHAGLRLENEPWDRTKRVIEAMVSMAMIMVSLPISIVLALAVWLQDPGPLLVAKVAVMRGGRSFNQLKLRSMVKDAEGSTGPVPAAPADARVTWLGNLLRRTHIDELPQMFNIARGEMSLVGPRPERTVFVQRHLRTIPRYAERHAVRPGLAGMAQVYGDYYSTPREKLRYDRLYIRNRGPGLDLKLFVSAVLLALFGISPRQRPRRRTPGIAVDRRFERAYAALRGEKAPPGPSADGRRAIDAPQASEEERHA